MCFDRRCSGTALTAVTTFVFVGCGPDRAATPIGFEAPDTIEVLSERVDSTLSLEETFRIVSDDSTGVLIGEISAFTALPDGRFAYWDRDFGELRLHAADGALIGVIGRAGEGPGEFTAPLAMQATSEGRLLVWDPGNTRVSILSSSGEYLRSFPVRSGAHSSTFTLADDSTVWVLARDPGRDDPNAGSVGDHPARLLVYGLDGTQTGALPLPLAGRSHAVFTTGPWLHYENFATKTLVAIGRGGRVAIGRNDSYHVDVWDGSRLVDIRRGWRPVAVPEAEAAAWRYYLEPFARMTGEDFAVPDTKPAYRGLALGDEGSLWVERYVEAVERRSDCIGRGTRKLCWLEPLVYDVFDPDSRYEGTVRMPWESKILQMRGRTVWVLERGIWDDEQVVRYRVRAR